MLAQLQSVYAIDVVWGFETTFAFCLLLTRDNTNSTMWRMVLYAHIGPSDYDYILSEAASQESDSYVS